MDAERFAQVRQIAERALDLPADQRVAFVTVEAGDDAKLRDEVLRILDAGIAGPDLDDVVSREQRALSDEGAGFPPGTQIGSYRIVRLIGSGGMGSVYEAEQERPRRRVALKTVRLGTDDPEALVRFRYESELLARLHHPGIAVVHESGIHRLSEGYELPYFAMEFVPGARTLTEYAWQEGLETADRLELFRRVCDAVHFGHGRGIVHRDLKPDNILVSEDGSPKIIDFGVARALGSDQEVTRIQTTHGQLVGTLPYMSPEQLSGDPERIDTRSDVYALGVVLYQLLTRRLPHDLTGMSFTEALRSLAEQPPMRLTAAAPSLPRELEWITTRALRKRSDFRYASVLDLERDVSRFLNRQVLEAGPPTTIYRVNCFVSRHRVGVGVFLMILLLALIAAGLILKGLSREWRLYQRANASRWFVSDMFSALRDDDRGSDLRVADLLDDARERVADMAGEDSWSTLDLHIALASGFQAVGRYEDALEQLEAVLQVMEEPIDQIRVRLDLGDTYHMMGKTGRSLESLKIAHELATRHHGPDDLETIQIQLKRALYVMMSGISRDALEMLQDARRRLVASDNQDPVIWTSLWINEANCLVEMGRYDEAHQAFHEFVELLGERLGSKLEGELDFARVADALRYVRGLKKEEIHPLHRELLYLSDEINSYVFDMSEDVEQDVSDAAIEVAREIVELKAAFYPEGHHEILDMQATLSIYLLRAEQWQEAEPMLRTVIDGLVAVHGENHAAISMHRMNLALGLANQGKTEEGLEEARESMRIAEAVYPADSRQLADRRFNFASLLANMGQQEEAVEPARQAFEVFHRLSGLENLRARQSLENLIWTLEDLGREEEAARYRVLLESAP